MEHGRNHALTSAAQHSRKAKSTRRNTLGHQHKSVTHQQQTGQPLHSPVPSACEPHVQVRLLGNVTVVEVRCTNKQTKKQTNPPRQKHPLACKNIRFAIFSQQPQIASLHLSHHRPEQRSITCRLCNKKTRGLAFGKSRAALPSGSPTIACQECVNRFLFLSGPIAVKFETYCGERNTIICCENKAQLIAAKRCSSSSHVGNKKT